MAVELRDKAKRLVDASKELEADDRASFLRQACRESAELWVEVQQLLDSGGHELPDSNPVQASEGLPLTTVDPVATAGKAGKFEIVERIGAGGFGVVYKGRDPILKRVVAVKTCTSEDEGFRKRFFREAEIAARLQHPNITTVHELGVQDGIPFLVQEYLSGEDLEEKIDRHETIPIEFKLRYLEQIARGLHYAHSQGVLHRDIKPANVRVLDDGSVKIMDFGIARLLNEETRLTSTGMTVGTVGYLAPEQLKAEAVDHRVDIFSFGVLAYELLAYTRPFKGSNFSQICYQLLQVDPPSLSLTFPTCDPRMADLIARCLSKEPANRPDDFATVEEELAELRSSWTPGSSMTVLALDPDQPTQLLDTGAEPVLQVGESAASPARTVSTHAPAPLSGSRQPEVASPYDPPVARGNKSPWLVVAGVVVLILLGSGFAFWWSSQESGVEPVEVAESSQAAVEDTASVSDVEVEVPLTDQPHSAEAPVQDPASAGETRLATTRDDSQSTSVESTAADIESPSSKVAPRADEPATRDPERKSPAATSREQPLVESPVLRQRLADRRENRLRSTEEESPEETPPPAAREPSVERRDASREDRANVGTKPPVEQEQKAIPDPPRGQPNTAESDSPARETKTSPPPPGAAQPAQVAREEDGPIKPGTEDRRPIPKVKAKPTYPERARRRKIEARVVVAVLVNEQGRVARAILKQRDDSGFGFNEAAVAAAKKTVFEPAMRNGVAGSMWTELPFEFRLR